MSRAKPADPTPEQAAALAAYAEWAGEGWKRQLRTDWLVAGSRWSGSYALLHQLRNSHGPSWLDTYEVPQ